VLLIPCPYCGERDESEFDYGGRTVDLPELNASSVEWHKALHLHEVDKNFIDEDWFHTVGCESWIRLKRNPDSHEFLEVDESQAGET